MCQINPELFNTFLGDAKGFPGKQQHWVLAFPASDLVSDVDRLIFFNAEYGLDVPLNSITGSRVGKPSSIKGREVARVAKSFRVNQDKWLPPDTIYLAVAFDAPHSFPAKFPWPWSYDDCPSELTQSGGLWAIYKPAQVVKPPIPSPLDETIDQLIDEAVDMGKAVGDTASKAGDALGKASTGIGVGIGLGLTAMGAAWWLLRKG